MSHFNNTFILSCGTSLYSYMIYPSFILFYLYATDTLEIVKIIWQYQKCYNIFIRALFSIVIGLGLIVYYFILSYKKLTLHQLWKYYDNLLGRKSGITTLEQKHYIFKNKNGN